MLRTLVIIAVVCVHFAAFAQSERDSLRLAYDLADHDTAKADLAARIGAAYEEQEEWDKAREAYEKRRRHSDNAGTICARHLRALLSIP